MMFPNLDWIRGALTRMLEDSSLSSSSFSSLLIFCSRAARLTSPTWTFFLKVTSLVSPSSLSTFNCIVLYDTCRHHVQDWYLIDKYWDLSNQHVIHTEHTLWTWSLSDAFSSWQISTYSRIDNKHRNRPHLSNILICGYGKFMFIEIIMYTFITIIHHSCMNYLF